MLGCEESSNLLNSIATRAASSSLGVFFVNNEEKRRIM